MAARTIATLAKPNANESKMVIGGRKPRAMWTTDVERKLSNIWANSLDELSRR